MKTFFTSYISNIIIVCVCAYICEWICSNSASENIKKSLAFISGLCVFVAVALPFIGGIKSLSESFDGITFSGYEGDHSSDTFIRLVEEETEKKLCDYFNEHLEISNCKVQLRLNDTNGKTAIESLNLYIPHGSSQLYDKASQLMSQVFKDGKIIYIGESNE